MSDNNENQNRDKLNRESVRQPKQTHGPEATVAKQPQIHDIRETPTNSLAKLAASSTLAQYLKQTEGLNKLLTPQMSSLGRLAEGNALAQHRKQRPTVNAIEALSDSSNNIENTIKSPVDFGNFLKAARKSKGLTQQQFADLSGVGRRFIVECEAGKPRLEFAKVLQVAAAAGIDIIAQKR
jgi:y4mF family transcriptional regulator